MVLTQVRVITYTVPEIVHVLIGFDIIEGEVKLIKCSKS